MNIHACPGCCSARIFSHWETDYDWNYTSKKGMFESFAQWLETTGKPIDTSSFDMITFNIEQMKQIGPTGLKLFKKFGFNVVTEPSSGNHGCAVYLLVRVNNPMTKEATGRWKTKRAFRDVVYNEERKVVKKAAPRKMFG